MGPPKSRLPRAANFLSPALVVQYSIVPHVVIVGKGSNIVDLMYPMQ